MENKVPIVSVVSSFSGLTMPAIGMGTASYPPVDAGTLKSAIVEAISAGYRHFDTAFIYGSEQPIGAAIAEALNIGLIKSRNELFITSKLWCTYAEPDLFSKEVSRFPVPKEEVSVIDIKTVWSAMEECQLLGLTKAIGVSNFSSRKLEEILSLAKIPPAVNQVEMNPLWQQKELNEYCKAKGIHVSAHSPLGSKGTLWGDNRIFDCHALKEIAEAKGKTIAQRWQICLRWVYEQGASVIAKSFNKKRMEENLEIFDWSLSVEELEKIRVLPQCKINSIGTFIEPSAELEAQL
ncbi:hypothetical protein GOBAR_AA02120 [Gossypium barbadense]|uniref:NADP-dependent oxidoreductase domain-containing protein n=1 Tax=Gossypium barbadense TaxID=3634 RepID=A0A2P5YSA5_GOSBA|nr:hypothetical protein GOBAR_AA02120 [Gossypium barbadense]